MEMRGGNGYIEDFVNARLVRDAHVGVLWEGTSNIAALDAIARAVGKTRSHEALAGSLKTLVRRIDAGAGDAFARAWTQLSIAPTAFATEVASRAENEDWARVAAGALYNTTSAVLMAWEASQSGNGKRLLLSRMIVEHRLSAGGSDGDARQSMGIESGGFAAGRRRCLAPRCVRAFLRTRRRCSENPAGAVQLASSALLAWSGANRDEHAMQHRHWLGKFFPEDGGKLRVELRDPLGRHARATPALARIRPRQASCE